MQHEAGLRLKCLGGRLAWVSVSPGSALFIWGGSHIRGGSRIAPSPSGPIAAPLTRAGIRIAQHQQYTCRPIPIHMPSISTQVRATRSISLDISNILTIL